MEKKNVFAELVLSCFSIKSYNAIIKNGFFKRLLYHILLTSLLFVISIYVPYAKFNAETGGIGALINEYVPSFSVTDGVLTVSEPVLIDDEGILVVINSSKCFEFDGYGFYAYDSVDAVDYSAYYSIEEYDSVALADSSRFMLYTSERGYQSAEFSEICETVGNFDRQSIIDFCNAGVPVLGAVVFVGMFIGILWNSFVSAIILMIISNMQKTNLSFMQCYTVSLYARTPFSLLFAILGALSIVVPFKWLLAIVGTAVYSSVIIKRLDYTDPEINTINF